MSEEIRAATEGRKLDEEREELVCTDCGLVYQQVIKLRPRACPRCNVFPIVGAKA